MPETNNAPRIFVLSGAGLSAESGVKTFRDNDGLWETHRVEDVATPEAFARDPQLVHRFYNARRNQLHTVQPNAAHHALARLEAGLDAAGGALVHVTQNVDDLCERAGETRTIHMHGELTRAFCTACDHRFAALQSLSPTTPCPACRTPGGPRPDIVWFGEMPYAMERIEAELMHADRFVSIGTSGAVYPAAGFVSAAKARGIPRLELNMEPSLGTSQFSDARHGPAGQLVPEWVEEILAQL